MIGPKTDREVEQHTKVKTSRRRTANPPISCVLKSIA